MNVHWSITLNPIIKYTEVSNVIRCEKFQRVEMLLKGVGALSLCAHQCPTFEFLPHTETSPCCRSESTARGPTCAPLVLRDELVAEYAGVFRSSVLKLSKVSLRPLLTELLSSQLQRKKKPKGDWIRFNIHFFLCELNSRNIRVASHISELCFTSIQDSKPSTSTITKLYFECSEDL